MTPSSRSTDAAFDAIVAEFLADFDAGRDPQPSAFLARYPEHAARLKEFFHHWDLANRHIQGAKDEIAAGQAARTDGNGTSALRDERGTIGAFRLLEQIGIGAQGIVYKAEQPGTRRMVALKVLRDGGLASPRVRQRFENEIQSVSRLQHANIVGIYECGQDRGHAYFAMEYVPGERLDAFYRSRALSVGETVTLFLQICDAVAYAHQQGVIHRDLKPSNILVDEHGRVRVLDFGLAKLQDVRDSHVTVTGEFTGTFPYAAPEQLSGNSRNVDVRTDVYALGLILFEMLTGRRPYDVRTFPRERMYECIVAASVPSPATHRPEIPDDLATIVLVALKKDPDERYQSAVALAQDLRRFLIGEPIEAKRDSRWYVLRTTLRYYRWQLRAVLAAVTVLIAFAVTITVLYTKARTAQATAEARAEMTRAGQSFLMGKLDRLQRLENAMVGVKQLSPDLPPVRRLDQPAIRLSADLREAIETAPGGIFTTPSSDAVPTGDATAWLLEHGEQLWALGSSLESGRLDFSYPDGGSNWVVYKPHDDTALAARLCALFIAQALVDASSGDHAEAARSLRAARSVALDVADGPFLLHKATALAGRREWYGTFLHLLGDAAGRGIDTSAYTGLIDDDPPLSALEPAMIAERLKALQFAEAALVEDSPGGAGHIDLDALDEATGGLYTRIGWLSPEDRELMDEVTPLAVIEHLDVVANDPGIPSDGVESPAERLLRPLLPGVRAGLRTWERVNAMRSGAAMAAWLCRERERVGRWPQTIPGDRKLPGDPLTGTGFGYTVEKDCLRLYSLNTDGADDGGACGRFGEPDTDVVLFESCPGDIGLLCPLVGVHDSVDQ